MSKIEIRDPRSTGKVKKMFCCLEEESDGTALLVSKGKNIDTSINIVDFLRQVPEKYIEEAINR